jgi:mediator of RNA polymerase II transcription subunit 13
VPTPPNSNKPAGLPEDLGTTLVKPPRGSGGSSGAGSIAGAMGCGTGAGILRPEELSKMFPTPPSLEHHPIASPCGQPETTLSEVSEAALVPRFKQEIYPNMGSPQEENIEVSTLYNQCRRSVIYMFVSFLVFQDWSFVFKPPLICKMVGSSKYAPLTNLPSQSLPPVSLPSHCVYKPSWQYPMQIQEKSNSTQR